MWVIFFAELYYILKVETGTEYPDVSLGFQHFINTYRNSIGDIHTPKYTYVIDDNTSKFINKDVMVFCVWSVWLINQILNLIVLLNFLIAVIS